MMLETEHYAEISLGLNLDWIKVFILEPGHYHRISHRYQYRYFYFLFFYIFYRTKYSITVTNQLILVSVAYTVIVPEPAL